jgi:predicted metal-dependent phosphoesterase TrpH
VSAIALTDHDTLEGVTVAVRAGQQLDVSVIGGCEFSVRVSWGEMHLLGYFLSPEDSVLERFLDDQRAMRLRRAQAIVARLDRVGAPIDVADVVGEAGCGSIGRPHVARVLVKAGFVAGIDGAFEKYLAAGKPAFVPKDLPAADQVAALVRSVNGVTSAAHLAHRANSRFLEELKRAGVDALEVLHPSHNDATAARLDALADRCGMLATGGSDWHGAGPMTPERAGIGSLNVPDAYLEGIERLHQERMAAARV